MSGPWLAPRGERNDVVKLVRRVVEKPANISRGLAYALLVFDQGDAHESLAVFTEPDARRHRDIGLFYQQLGKFHAAQILERLGNRRPGKHRRARSRHGPSGAAETLHQHVAPAA